MQKWLFNLKIEVMKDSLVVKIFEAVFGWEGYSVDQMRSKVVSFMKEEGLSLEEVLEEIGYSQSIARGGMIMDGQCDSIG
jgi:hypothetical protein